MLSFVTSFFHLIFSRFIHVVACISTSFLFSFFLFGLAHGMWKCPGQGSNPYHSSNPNHHSDNPRSLSYCTKRQFLTSFFVCLFVLGPQVWHMEVPRLGVESAAVVSLHHSHNSVGSKLCLDLWHSSGQCQILGPLSGY